jgi:hypothetical protein
VRRCFPEIVRSARHKVAERTNFVCVETRIDVHPLFLPEKAKTLDPVSGSSVFAFD